MQRDYDDIPGTIVFDGRRSRRGYPLNRFLMSLNRPGNRDAFRADEEGYLDRFELDPEQRQAVRDRAWLRLLELGGNIFYTYKLAACDGLTFQDLAGAQTGMSADEYAQMMLRGGRPIEHNRSRSEWLGESGGTDGEGRAGAAGRRANAATAGHAERPEGTGRADNADGGGAAF